VRQNGVLFIGGCALAILIGTRGELGLLVVLYSINVFLSLALAKAGLCRYWWTRRADVRHWPLRLGVAGAGFAIVAMILIVTLTQKAIRRKRERLDASLCQLEGFCAKAGIGTRRVVGQSTDTIAELERLIKDTVACFPGCVCFTNQLILPAGRRFGERMHNQTALGLQRRLHFHGIPLIVLPITLR
jgi:hypothetical protein